MNDEQFRKKWLQLREKYERLGIRLFRKATRKALQGIPDNLSEFGYPAQIEVGIREEPLREALTQFYYTVGLSHGKRINKAIKKEMTKRFVIPGFEDIFAQDVAQWIRDNGGKKIVSMRQGLAYLVTQYIAKGLEDGKSIDTISRELHKSFGGTRFYRWQLERIARTETTAAANFGALRAGENAQIETGKRWISSHNGRTRRIMKGDLYDHYAMHRVTVAGIKTPFEVPGARGADLLQYPGDPKGRAANVINCRCTVAIVPLRDEDGKLVFRGSGRTPVLRGPGRVQHPPGRSNVITTPRIPKPKPVPKPKPPKPGKYPTITVGKPRGKFVPAKSELEAAQRITNMVNGPVSLKGMSKPQYNALLDIMEQEHSFSSLAGLKGGIKFVERGTTRRLARANGWYRPWKEEITIARGAMRDKTPRPYAPDYKDQVKQWQGHIKNLETEYSLTGADQWRSPRALGALKRQINKYKRTVQALELKIKAGEKALYWSNSAMEANGLKAMQMTMVHEIGHYRHFHQLRHAKVTFRKAWSFSEYGKTDMDEYFTEWYTYWRKGGKENIIPKQLLELFKQLAGMGPRTSF